MFYYIIHFFTCYFNLGFKMLLFLIILLIIQIIKRKLAFKSKKKIILSNFQTPPTISFKNHSPQKKLKISNKNNDFIGIFLCWYLPRRSTKSVDSWPVESKLVIVPLPGPHLVSLKVKKENKNGKEWFFNIKLVSFT